MLLRSLGVNKKNKYLYVLNVEGVGKLRKSSGKLILYTIAGQGSSKTELFGQVPKVKKNINNLFHIYARSWRRRLCK